MALSRDQELWACALAVEREHGVAAFLHAAMEIDRLDAAGEEKQPVSGVRCSDGSSSSKSPRTRQRVEARSPPSSPVGVLTGLEKDVR